MIKIAIVGNIASGKSEIQKYLINKDYVVLDTDMMTHDILMDGAEVAKAFEEYDIFEFGRLSKEKLSKLVFGNYELKKKLENIVHPLIAEEIQTSFNTFKDEKYLFISVPLLFEVGWENMFDKIIFVSIDEKLQLERLMNRNNYSKEEAELRINSQMPQDEKIKKSDFTIENNADIKTLHNLIENVLAKLN